MQTITYRGVLDQARQLTSDEQLKLLEDLAAIVRKKITAKPKHSIMELKGLGKEIWEGIDVEKYIEEERNSWDG